jgi:ammonia channel protein AmtB
MAFNVVDFVNGAIVHAKAAFHALVSIIGVFSLPDREGLKGEFIIFVHFLPLLQPNDRIIILSLHNSHVFHNSWISTLS